MQISIIFSLSPSTQTVRSFFHHGPKILKTYYLTWSLTWLLTSTKSFRIVHVNVVFVAGIAVNTRQGMLLKFHSRFCFYFLTVNQLINKMSNFSFAVLVRGFKLINLPSERPSVVCYNCFQIIHHLLAFICECLREIYYNYCALLFVKIIKQQYVTDIVK